MARKLRIDMTGVRYGRLVGVAFSHTGPDGHAHWRFACDCGGQVVANGRNVRAGSTASCGCLHREIAAARLTTHGRRARKRHDATYRAWQAMNDRCGGADVTAVWRCDFEVFAADLGERPDGTVLMRFDERETYGPANCGWAPIRSRSERACDAWRRRTGAGQMAAIV